MYPEDLNGFRGGAAQPSADAERRRLADGIPSIVAAQFGEGRQHFFHGQMAFVARCDHGRIIGNPIILRRPLGAQRLSFGGSRSESSRPPQHELRVSRERRLESGVPWRVQAIVPVLVELHGAEQANAIPSEGSKTPHPSRLISLRFLRSIASRPIDIPPGCTTVAQARDRPAPLQCLRTAQ